jgi:uncharacterized protein YeaO (DUF488 family)
MVTMDNKGAKVLWDSADASRRIAGTGLGHDDSRREPMNMARSSDRRTEGPEGPGVEVRRVYDRHYGDDAVCRVLVDRLWPRGVSKDDVHLHEWLKTVAPSTELRRWYGHDLRRFDEFASRYQRELSVPPAADAVEHLVELARSQRVVLLTATRDVEHSGARVLAEHLAARSSGSRHRFSTSSRP